MGCWRNPVDPVSPLINFERGCMFSDKPQNAIDSIIGTACKINGDVTFRGGMRVDGCIYGNLCADPLGPWRDIFMDAFLRDAFCSCIL